MLRNTNEKPLAGFSGTCHAKRHHRTHYVRADDECIGARRRLCMPLFEWKLLRFQQSNGNKNRKTIGVRSRIISITWKQFYTLWWARVSEKYERRKRPSAITTHEIPHSFFSLNSISFICLLINERAWASQISANFVWGRDENEEKFEEKKQNNVRASQASRRKCWCNQIASINLFTNSHTGRWRRANGASLVPSLCSA